MKRRGHLRRIDRDDVPAAGPRRAPKPAGAQVRTCASCGRRAPVYLDPAGGWAWCSACGSAA